MHQDLGSIPNGADGRLVMVPLLSRPHLLRTYVACLFFTLFPPLPPGETRPFADPNGNDGCCRFVTCKLAH